MEIVGDLELAPESPRQSGCVVKAPGASGYCPFIVAAEQRQRAAWLIQVVVYIPNSTMVGQVQQHRELQDRNLADCPRTLDVDINPNLDGSHRSSVRTQFRHTNGDVVFTARIGGQPWTSSQVTFPALAKQWSG